jgi:hypothetical protein
VSFSESAVPFTESAAPFGDAWDRGLRLACVLVRDDRVELLVRDERFARPLVFASDDREDPDLDEPDFLAVLVRDLV